MTEFDHLSRAIDEITPRLENALAGDSVSNRQNLDASLQLRSTTCWLATAALQHVLLDEYNIKTNRLKALPPKAPRGMSSRREQHVILSTDQYVIDPTNSQFFSYVGLDSHRAQRESLTNLYPEQKIAVFERENAAEFANEFAIRAKFLQENLGPRQESDFLTLPPLDSLLHTDFDELAAVYSDIWNLDNYSSFSVEEQYEKQPSYEAKVGRIVMAMSGIGTKAA
jgi:hypothetical protein